MRMFRVMTWNCLSLAGISRLREFCEALRLRRKKDRFAAVALQETRWIEAVSVPGFSVHCCPAVRRGARGVALLVADGFTVCRSVAEGDTMLAVTVEGVSSRGGRVTLVTGHAPHGGADGLIIAEWWHRFDFFVSKLREAEAEQLRPTPVIVLGDFNSRLRSPSPQEIANHQEKTLVQVHNFNSECFEDFLLGQGFVACNAMFPKPQRKLVTHVSNNGGRTSQLDVICIEKRWASAVIDTTTIEPLVPSDHRPLVAKFRLRLRAASQPHTIAAAKHDAKPDWQCVLSSAEICSEILTKVTNGGGDVKWTALVEAYNAILPTLPKHEPVERVKSAAPLQRQSLRQLGDLVERHRRLKESHDKEIEEEVWAAVGVWIEEARQRPARAWKEMLSLRSAAGGKKEAPPASASSTEDIIKWYSDIDGKDRHPPGTTTKFAQRLSTAQCVVKDGEFDRKEVEQGLCDLNSGRAVGVDGIPAEFLKLPVLLDIVHNYCNQYWHGKADPMWLMTQLKLLPKKGDTTLVKNTRGIALICTILKLINRLCLNRLRALDPHLQPYQNGFREGRGTTEQAMALQIIFDRARASGKDCVGLYVDYAKAFNSVTFEALRASLVAFAVPAALIECVLRCYDGHTISIPEALKKEVPPAASAADDRRSKRGRRSSAAAPEGAGAPRNVADEKPPQYSVESGVLQGDTCAPYLFVIVLDCILHDSIKLEDGLRLDGADPVDTGERSRQLLPRAAKQRRSDIYIPWLGFADDLCFVSRTTAAAERQLRALQTLSTQCGLEINVAKGKTEFQFFNNSGGVDGPGPIVAVGGKEVERVDDYTYLGQQPAAVEKAFVKRKQLAWLACRSFSQLWKSTAPSKLKESFVTSIVQTVFVYGGQAWPSTAEWTQRIDSTYDAMLRYCLGSAYNTLELHRGGRIPMLSSLLTLRRVNTVGHALRRDQPLSLLLRKQPKRLGKKMSLERCILRDLRPFFARGEDERSGWHDAAQNKGEWRDMARQVAAEQEEKVYEKLRRQHQKRHERPQRAAEVAKKAMQTINPTNMSVLSDPTVSVSDKFSICDCFYGKGSFSEKHDADFEVSETALDVVLQWIENKSAEMEARINVFVKCKPLAS